MYGDYRDKFHRQDSTTGSEGGLGTDQSWNSGQNQQDGSGFQYGSYKESDAVKQAYNHLQQQLAAKPGAYQSQWQAQLNDTINKIMNREKFEYDINGDALYNQYKDMYTTQGQMAMMDTMGMASAMTGGYGNSYAQSVGQQVYQGYLQQLNDKIPELYQMALNKYQMEGDEMYNQYALLGSQEEQDYGRYRDTVADWNAALDRAQNQYNVERDYDYGKYTDSRNFEYGKYSDDRAYNYQVERDKVLDAQWQAEFDEAVRQFQLQWDAEHPTSSGSGGGGGGGDSTGTNPGTVDGSDAYADYQYAISNGYGGATAVEKLKEAGYSDAEINAGLETYKEQVIDPLSKPQKDKNGVM